MKLAVYIAVFVSLLAFLTVFMEQARASETHWDRMTPEEADRELQDLQQLSFPKRIVAVSERFLGAAYRLDSLGEGRGEDADPTFRLDAFDCLTFVETVMAMAESNSLEDAKKTLQFIRYKQGRIGWRFRHHLTWGQWLVENIEARRVEISTRRIAGDAAKSSAKTYRTKCNYSEKWKSWCTRLGDMAPQGEVAFPIVGVSWAIKHAKEIPEGTLLFVVMQDRPWLPYRVKHVGMVVQRKGKPLFRHATKTHGKVKDVSLVGYLKTLLEFETWPVEGVLFATPLEQIDPHRVRRLYERKYPPIPLKPNQPR